MQKIPNSKMTLKNILTSFDAPSRKDFDEYDISKELRTLVPTENSDILEFELLAEMMAFGFSEDNQNSKIGWGTYFGPSAVWSNQDGTTMESPSITFINSQIIEYWEKRAIEVVNPILVSRYCGLVWDFKNKIIGEKPTHKICRIYVRALLEQANGSYFKNEKSIFTKLSRALELSIGLNDSNLINDSKIAIIEFEKKHSQDNKPGLWGYSFDLLIGHKRIELSKQEEDDIINELEAKLDRLTKHIIIDPWAAENAAERLASYYLKKQKVDDVKRVVSLLAKAYQKIIDDSLPIQASGTLGHLYKIYEKYNLKEDAEKVLLKIREIGHKTEDQFKLSSSSFDIPKKEFDIYIDAMVSGNIEDVFHRVIRQFIPKKEAAKEQIFDLSKKSPLYFLSNISISDDKGRVLATIGSLENDLNGHIIHHVSQSLRFASIFLTPIIQQAVTRFGLDKTHVLKFLELSPIIQAGRIEIIERALDAFFNKDYVVAIHLLIPQIEESIRVIVETSGGNVLKPARSGGYHLKTFDDILRDDIVRNVLDDDLVDYFRIIFTDPRGWNLRNNVCHGMTNSNMFDQQTADRVFHALLCIGLIKRSG
jgi:hypothetical protein